MSNDFLYDDILLVIFQLSNAQTLLKCQLVSRAWNVMILQNDCFLWKHRCPKIASSVMPDSFSWRKLYQSQYWFTLGLRNAACKEPQTIDPLIVKSLIPSQNEQMALPRVKLQDFSTVSYDIQDGAIWTVTSSNQRLSLITHDSQIMYPTEACVKWIEPRHESPYLILNLWQGHHLGGFVSVWTTENKKPVELYTQRVYPVYHNGVVDGSSYLCFPGWWHHDNVENVLTLFQILQSELKCTWKIEFASRILDATLSQNLVACLTQKETGSGQVIYMMESKTGRLLTRIEDNLLSNESPVQKLAITRFGLLLVQSLGRIMLYSSMGDKLANYDLRNSLDVAPFLMNFDQTILVFPSLNLPERYNLLDIQSGQRYQLDLSKEDMESNDIYIFSFNELDRTPVVEQLKLK